MGCPQSVCIGDFRLPCTLSGGGPIVGLWPKAESRRDASEFRRRMLSGHSVERRRLPLRPLADEFGAAIRCLLLRGISRPNLGRREKSATAAGCVKTYFYRQLFHSSVPRVLPA